ncbi:hypothetical protein BH11BAC2_BH11BAC2_19810 [soil metagenome]
MLISFLAGLLISLVGSLPLGYLNAMAMVLSSSEGVKSATLFAAGVTLVESLYLIVTLFLMNMLLAHLEVQGWLHLISLIFLTFLAIASFYAYFKSEKNVKRPLVKSKTNRFVLGVAMCAVNPLQLAFWSGWLLYSLNKGWLTYTSSSLIVYVAGAGIGTALSLLIFIFAGNKFSNFMRLHQKSVLLVMGFLFLILATAQIFKI